MLNKNKKEKFVHDGTEIWVDHYVPCPDFKIITGGDWDDSEKTGIDFINDVVNVQDIIFKENWDNILTRNIIFDHINKEHLKLIVNNENKK